MSLKLDVDVVMMNAINASAPQVGCKRLRRKKISGVSYMKIWSDYFGKEEG